MKKQKMHIYRGYFVKILIKYLNVLKNHPKIIEYL